MARELHCVILAAGEGRRMRSALPKALLPLAGRPLLAHVLEALRRLAPAGIHVVYGHGGEALRRAFAAEAGLGWIEQRERLGTGHALMVALPALPTGARVLVALGDVPVPDEEALRGLAEGSGLAGLVARPADPSGYGRVRLDGAGRIEAVVEERDASAEERALPLVFTGLLAAEAEDLRRWLPALDRANAQGEYYLTQVFRLAAAEGRPARAVTSADPLSGLGVNDAAQLAALERALQRRAAERLLAAGVRMADPARVELRGELRAGRDVELDIDVILEGRVELGDEVRIGPFCRLRDCRLAAGTEVLGHCELEGVETLGPCRIGPFARLRPGTRLAAGVQLGNFVEVKNSLLGEGAKANHLSYLGDAEVGAGSNIGAGTITCNYDGVAKHRTRIGAGAFVGSNCALVAPLVVGEGATIGAGSAITRDVPAGALAVARARERVIPGWRRRPRRGAALEGTGAGAENLPGGEERSR